MKALCQDCLSFRNYDKSYDELNTSEKCPICGGDLCPCTDCQRTGENLEKGKILNGELKSDIDITKWTAEKGITSN